MVMLSKKIFCDMLQITISACLRLCRMFQNLMTIYKGNWQLIDNLLSLLKRKGSKELEQFKHLS